MCPFTIELERELDQDVVDEMNSRDLIRAVDDISASLCDESHEMTAHNILPVSAGVKRRADPTTLPLAKKVKLPIRAGDYAVSSFLGEYANISHEIDMKLMKKGLPDIENLLSRAQHLQSLAKTSKDRSAMTHLMDELDVLKDLVPCESYEKHKALRPDRGRQVTPSVIDELGNHFHPATICSKLSKSGAILPGGVGRLLKWKLSQDWLCKIQRPATLGEVCYGRTIAYHKKGKLWGLGRVELVIEQSNKHFQMADKLDVNNHESFIAIREFVLKTTCQHLGKVGGPFKLQDNVEFIPMECIFCVPIQLELLMSLMQFKGTKMVKLTCNQNDTI